MSQVESIEYLTANIGRTVENLVKTTAPNTDLYLITPYFKPWATLQKEINTAATKNNIRIKLLLRAGEEQKPTVFSLLKEYNEFVDIKILADLHAKIYCNDECAMISSLNLLETSAIGCVETGIKVRKDSVESIKLFESICSNAEDLWNKGLEITTLTKENSSQKPKRSNNSSKSQSLGSVSNSSNESETSSLFKNVALFAINAAATWLTAPTPSSISGRTTAFCISCKGEITKDIDKPRCKSCWYKNKDKSTPGDYCHFCGKDCKRSNPLCLSCNDSLKK